MEISVFLALVVIEVIPDKHITIYLGLYLSQRNTQVSNTRKTL